MEESTCSVDRNTKKVALWGQMDSLPLRKISNASLSSTNIPLLMKI